MTQTYVMIFSGSFATRGAVKAWAAASDLVSTWRYDLPSSIYLVSEASADELDTDLEHTFGKRG